MKKWTKGNVSGMKRTARSGGGRRLYNVVGFLELPFPDVNKYVCVPHTWVLTMSKKKAFVTYPNEHSLAIMDEAKSRKRPNEDWRFYEATVVYQTDSFEDANNWIETRRDEPCGIENSKRDTTEAKEPTLDRKLRSASRPRRSVEKGKAWVSVKHVRRESLVPWVSVRLPPRPYYIDDTEVVSADELARRVAMAIDPPAVSGDTERRQPVVGNNKPIQTETESVARLEDKGSCERRLPDIEEGGSVIPDQSAAAKPHQKPTLPASPDGEPEPSLTAVDTGLGEDDYENDVSDPVIAIEEPLYTGKTAAHNPEQVPQPEQINEARITLVHNENWPPQQRPLDAPVGQSKAADLYPKTHFHQLSITPRTNPRPPSAAVAVVQLPKNRHHQATFLPPTAAPSPRMQEANGSFTAATSTQKRPHSRGLISNSSSLPYYITNMMNTSSQLPSVSIRGKSPSVIQTPVAKRICVDNITSSFTSQEPSTSTARQHSFDHWDVKQARQLVQKRPDDVFRQSTSNARSDFGVAAIDLRVPHITSSSTQNLPSVAQHSHSFAQPSLDLRVPQRNITTSYIAPVAKRICVDNITSSLTRQEPSTSTARHHSFDHWNATEARQLLQKYPDEVFGQSTSNARSNLGAAAIDLSVPHVNITTSSTRNPPSLAQYSQPFGQPSHLQHYLMLQRQYIERMALNNRVEPVVYTDRNPYLPNAMTNQLLLQHYSQFDSLSTGSVQDILRHEAPIQLTGTHIQSQINHFAQHPQYQPHESVNYPQQRQYQVPVAVPVQYQGLPNQSLQYQVNPQITEHQGVIRPIPYLPKTPCNPPLEDRRAYLLQDPRVQGRLNENPTEYQILNLVVPRNVFVEAEPTVSAEVQVEAPSASQREIGIAYQNPRTNKLVVDQATEVDPVMDADYCGDEAGSDENTHCGVDRGCQTDAHPEIEQNLLYSEEDSEPEIARDEYSDDGECESESGGDALGDNRPTLPQSPSMRQGTAREVELLNLFGTFFDEMSSSFGNAHDLLNQFRNSMLKCAELFESLLGKVKENQQRVQLQTSTKTVSERSIPDKSISVNQRIDHPHPSPFVLPPEYDPNNPEWTRKYQGMEPGLVELMPHTKVYVSIKGLENCQRAAKDCRMLTRMLLTEVFSRSALSVCSLTGGKAKAYKPLDCDVRPGLDEVARMVLLVYVEKFGAERGWKTDDTRGIISSMRTKILDYRAKYGKVNRD